MGLSEREQQMLDEMERQLYRSEADVMQAPKSRAQLNTRYVVFGVLTIIAGLGLLIAAVSLQMLWLGMIGFAVMFVGALLAFSKTDAPSSTSGSQSSRSKSSKPSLADRMSARWNERMQGDR